MTSFREAPGRPDRDVERRRARRPARRALHRRGRAPDDVRRPLRRLPLRRRRLAPPSSRRWPAARPRRRPPSRSASPAHGDVLDEREPAAESARLIGTDHHDTAMAESDFLAELATLRPAARGALRHPVRPRAAPALALRRRDVKVVLAGQGADEPHGGYGRHQAAALLGAPAPCPGRAGVARRPRSRARVPRAARARRVAHLLGGRGDAERLLRLVEISDAQVRTALWPTAGAPAAARRRPSASPRPRRARRRARPRPARPGPLPRHAHVPPRRHPDLQRQDVDGRRPRAARAVPRRRADALRGAHPGRAARAPARRQAPPPRGDGAPRSRRRSPTARSTGSRPRTTTGCAPRSGAEVGAATRPARRAGRAGRPGPSRASWTSTAAAAPTTRRSSTACSSCPSGTAAFVEAREPVARVKRILYVHSRKASFVAIDREILAERYEVEDLYQPGRVPPLDGHPRRAARRPRVRLVRLLAHVPPDHARLAAAQAVGDDHRRLRHGEHAGHRLRLPAGRPAALGEPLDHAPRHAGWSRTRVQPRGDRAQHADPARARDGLHHGVPDPFGDLSPAPKERAGAHGRAPRPLHARAEGAPPVRRRPRRGCPTCASCSWASGTTTRSRSCARCAGDNVEFTGWLSDEDLHAMYRRAAVYVQASRHEGFGLAVAEAMLAGCVPVVMNVTAMPEVVGDAGRADRLAGPGGRWPTASGGRSTWARTRRRRARERILTAFPMETPRRASSGQTLRVVPRRSTPPADGEPDAIHSGAAPGARDGRATRCCSSSARWCTSCTARASGRPSCSRPRRRLERRRRARLARPARARRAALPALLRRHRAGPARVPGLRRDARRSGERAPAAADAAARAVAAVVALLGAAAAGFAVSELTSDDGDGDGAAPREPSRRPRPRRAAGGRPSERGRRVPSHGRRGRRGAGRLAR